MDDKIRHLNGALNTILTPRSGNLNEPRGDGMGEGGGVARGGILKLRNDQYIINSLIRVDFRYFICLFFIPSLLQQ